MKGKLKVIIITLLLLLIGTGVLLWRVSSVSRDIAAKAEAHLKEERDLLEDQNGKAIDEVKEINIIPLKISGDGKNVVTTDFDSVEQIYSAEKSAEVEENLTDIKRNKACTLQDALWAYNPYGTNHNSMYVYFKTSGNCYCRYTISVKDDKVPDFTRTALTNTSRNVTKEHEYQLIGLVAGKTNYITLRLYNADDELSETQTFSVDIPGSRMEASTFLGTEDGYSKTSISNGLYVVFQDGKKATNSGNGKKKKAEKRYGILLYDNSGILRAEIPTDGYVGRNMEEVYDTLLYASSDTQVSEVNALGQVMKTIPLKGYRQSGEFTYDGYGNLFMIVNRIQKKEIPRSEIIKLELETGDVEEMVDMTELLPAVYKNAVKRAGKKNPDWVGLNSIQVLDPNTLLLSGTKLSSIFKVSAIGSLMTKIDYIVADKKIYQSYKTLQKKVLTKSAGEDAEPEETPIVDNILHQPAPKDPFDSFYAQEDLKYQAKSEEGQCVISILNCNSGSGAKNTGHSNYCSYLVDETAGTYEEESSRELDKTEKDGNLVQQKDSFIYCCSDKKLFQESDMAGKLIKQFTVQQRPYRVYKNDFKNFWFY